MDQPTPRSSSLGSPRSVFFLALSAILLAATILLPRPAEAAPARSATSCWNVYLPFIANRSSMSALIRDFSFPALMGSSPELAPIGTLLNCVGSGLQPTKIAINPSTNKVYVTNFVSNTVSVIDGGTNLVVNTITVGGSPRGIAYNPTTNLLYVANTCQLVKSSCSPSLSVIDSGTDGVVATIGLPSYPWHVDVNPITNKVYVTLYAAGQLAVVDGATNTYETEIPLGGRFLYSPAVNPNTNLIYVSNGDPAYDNVAVIDGVTNQVIQTISVGGAPDGEAVDTTLNQIYVSNQFPNPTTGYPAGVTVINGAPGANNAILGEVSIGAPDAIAANPTTHEVFACNLGNNADSVVVFDGSTTGFPTLGAITVNLTPNGDAVNPTTNVLYVSSQGQNTVQAFAP